MGQQSLPQSFPRGANAIGELFDCGVIGDLATHPATRQECACYFLGANEEPDAGLHGFALTPTFYSENQLDRYCRSAKGRAEINEKADTIFPDWDKTNARWIEQD